MNHSSTFENIPYLCIVKIINNRPVQVVKVCKKKMKTNGISIEQLAERLGENVWVKGDLRRIYLNEAGWNTKKMRTKTFIFEKDGEFMVSCKIECPSQPYQWIESQEQEVKDSVYNEIKNAIADLEETNVVVAEKESKEKSITPKDIFQRNKILTPEIAESLIGKKLAVSNPEYRANTPDVRIFILKGVITKFDAAAKEKSSKYESIQDMWIKENNQRAIEWAKKRLVLDYEGDNPYASCEEDYFFGSDSDRPIYFIEINDK